MAGIISLRFWTQGLHVCRPKKSTLCLQTVVETVIDLKTHSFSATRGRQSYIWPRSCQVVSSYIQSMAKFRGSLYISLVIWQFWMIDFFTLLIRPIQRKPLRKTSGLFWQDCHFPGSKSAYWWGGCPGACGQNPDIPREGELCTTLASCVWFHPSN